MVKGRIEMTITDRQTDRKKAERRAISAKRTLKK